MIATNLALDGLGADLALEYTFAFFGTRSASGVIVVMLRSAAWGSLKMVVTTVVAVVTPATVMVMPTAAKAQTHVWIYNLNIHSLLY